MRVYVVKTDDYPSLGWCVFRDLDGALAELRTILSEIDQPGPITVSVKEMAEAEFAMLPEFES